MIKGVTATVAYLANKAKEHTKDPYKHQVLDKIAEIVPWYQRRDLSTWESEVQKLEWDYVEDTTTVSWKLIGEIFELGRFNLYGAYSPKWTKEEFEALRELFGIEGIEVMGEFDVSTW